MLSCPSAGVAAMMRSAARPVMPGGQPAVVPHTKGSRCTLAVVRNPAREMSARSRSKPSVAENWALATRASCWKNLRTLLGQCEGGHRDEQAGGDGHHQLDEREASSARLGAGRSRAFVMLASHVLRERAGEVDEVVSLERRRDLADVDARDRRSSCRLRRCPPPPSRSQYTRTSARMR